MSDKDITIGIKTTADTKGAQSAAKSLDQLKKEASEANKALRDFKASSAGLNDVGSRAKAAANDLGQMEKQVGKLGTSRGNSGMAVLELSRAFEDAQYGIRGVLNNIPGIITQLGGGAGLAGVISLVAVAGSSLWTIMSSGSKDAKKEAVDFLDIYKKIADEFGNAALEIEKKRGEGIEKNAANKKAAAADEQRTADAAAKLEQQRIKDTGVIEVGRAKLELLQLDDTLSRSSGETAVRLAKEREQIIKNIVALEEKSVEMARQSEARAAKVKVDAAKANLDNASGTAEFAQGRFFDAEREKSGTADRLAAAITDQTRTIDALIQLQSEARAGAASSTNPFNTLGFQDTVLELEQKIQAAYKNPSETEAALKVKLEQAGATSEEAKANFKTASEDQKAAAEALKAAATNYESLLASQDQSRVSSLQQQELGAGEEILKVGRDVTQAAKDAIAQIIANAGNQGRGVNPQEQEAINAIQGIITDATPDAQQGGQLSTVLAMLNVTLAAKDATLSTGVEALLQTTRALTKKYESLNQKIADTKEKVDQLK